MKKTVVAVAAAGQVSGRLTLWVWKHGQRGCRIENRIRRGRQDIDMDEMWTRRRRMGRCGARCVKARGTKASACWPSQTALKQQQPSPPVLVNPYHPLTHPSPLTTSSGFLGNPLFYHDYNECRSSSLLVLKRLCFACQFTRLWNIDHCGGDMSVGFEDCI